MRLLHIELTSRCNERCVHCYIPHEEKNRDMDSALLFSIIDQCAEMGLETISFSGGEPMLHPGFTRALERAAHHNFEIIVFSNLTLLDEDSADRLKECAARVYASLYSMDNAIHDGITGLDGSCEKTKQGIQTLRGKGIEVFVICPLMKHNKDSYPGVHGFARGQRAVAYPNTFITAQSGGGRANLAHRLSVDEALDVIRWGFENDNAYDAEWFLPDYAGSRRGLYWVHRICATIVCVNARGEVLPRPDWHYVLGDLNFQTLRDVWEHSPEIPKVRALGDLRNFPRCTSCPDIQFCGMSLEGNVNETGDPHAIPPEICVLARKERELVHGMHHAYKQKFGAFKGIHSVEAALAFVRKEPECFSNIPYEHRSREVCLIGIAACGMVCKFVPQKLHSEEFFLAAVAVNKNGKALKYVPPEYCTIKVIKTALTLHPGALNADELEGIGWKLYKKEKYDEAIFLLDRRGLQKSP